MDFYICGNVFVPLRSGPSHRSEMVSQVLFGERYSITDQAGHWYKIETEFDKDAGWIDIDHAQHSVTGQAETSFVLNRSLLCFKSDGTKLVLEPGCEIFSPDFKNKTFRNGQDTYKAGDEFSRSHIEANESIADTAMRFINSPYIWGGRIPSGIDCSGFTQLVYKIHGKPIPRNSYQQAEIGSAVNFIDEAKPGDLAFFDDDTGRITHVGMILSHGLIIHGSGRVRIDPIDHQGIYKQEFQRYSHHLRTIRRIL